MLEECSEMRIFAGSGNWAFSGVSNLCPKYPQLFPAHAGFLSSHVGRSEATWGWPRVTPGDGPFSADHKAGSDHLSEIFLSKGKNTNQRNPKVSSLQIRIIWLHAKDNLPCISIRLFRSFRGLCGSASYHASAQEWPSSLSPIPPLQVKLEHMLVAYQGKISNLQMIMHFHKILTTIKRVKYWVPVWRVAPLKFQTSQVWPGKYPRTPTEYVPLIWNLTAE